MTASPTLGRNDPCHCGSGRKYKLCCLAKDEAAGREARASAAAEQEAVADTEPAAPTHAAPQKGRAQAHQPWKAGAQNTRGFQKFSSPRKVGS